MRLDPFPSHRLHIRPHFDDSDSATALEITYTIQHPPLHSPDTAYPELYPLFTYDTFSNNVPSHPYTADNVTVSDSLGPLPLTFTTTSDTHSKSTQQWSVPRPPRGQLTLHAVVPPRRVDIKTRLGARTDLRSDQGGLVGSGIYFLPTLISEDPGPTSSSSSASASATTSGNTPLYNHIVEWDLSRAPRGTRAIWSHGEGPQRITRTGKHDLLQTTVFMVGPVRSYPAEPLPGDSAGPGFCGLYWFGDELPENMEELKPFNTDIFKPMAAFFRDGGSTYRVFMRKSLVGIGGTGFDASYVLEYDGRFRFERKSEIQELFAHEMVHSWAIMDPELPQEDGFIEENGWYIEGIADWYCLVLPYRFSVVENGEDYVAGVLNSHLSEYLTNPERTMTMRRSHETFFDNWYAEKISYDRGFAYFCLMDWRLRKAAGVTDDPKATGPLDEIVVDFAVRRKKGEVIRQKDWLESVRKHLPADGGVDYEKELRDMLQGKLIDLSETRVLAGENRFHVEQQRVLQFGFGRNSVSTRIVEEVVPGSNAELAGLREGDKILDNPRAGRVMQEPLARYFLKVERDGRVFKIKWLPREKRTVGVFQMERFKG